MIFWAKYPLFWFSSHHCGDQILRWQMTSHLLVFFEKKIVAKNMSSILLKEKEIKTGSSAFLTAPGQRPMYLFFLILIFNLSWAWIYEKKILNLVGSMTWIACLTGLTNRPGYDYFINLCCLLYFLSLKFFKKMQFHPLTLMIYFSFI